MNWTIQHLESQNYVTIICEGNFSIQDWCLMKNNLLTQPFWLPGMNIFYDYRKTSFEGVYLDDLRLWVEKRITEDERIGEGKTALLMKSLRDYGIGRQYELLIEGKVSGKIMVFREESEAINWLNSKA